MNERGRPIFAALLLAGALALAGCGGDDTTSGGSGVFGSGTGGGGVGGGGGGGTSAPAPSLGSGCAGDASAGDLTCMSLSASAASLPADNTSTSNITATLTRNGAGLPGVIVNFTLSSTTLGSLTATSGVTSASGTVTTTFQAGGTIGAIGITAAPTTITGVTNTIALSLTQPPASTPGGIQFVSATPFTLGVVGSGQPTTSSATFRVTDAQGGPLPNQTVSFTMVGPVGAFIGQNDGTPTTATGNTNSAGDVSVPLNAGTAAGPVTIRADVTVGGTTFTTSTSVISIGGAVPSAGHFSLATSRFNLPGLVRDGFTATLSVFVADRFSNFNVLAGTQVSFFTEAGAVDTSVNLDATGAGTVTIRTQEPRPLNFLTAPAPRNGHLEVIAVARGEEAFDDENGNGLFDPGVDIFDASMDLGEPFVDANDNDVRDAGEQFIDTNQNGSYDGPNGVWDGPGCTQAGCNQSPTIWRSILLQFSGHLIQSGHIGCVVSPTTFALTNNTSQTFTLSLFDVNNNAPVPGTTSSIAVTGATGTGIASIAVVDGVSTGPFVRTFRISDPDPVNTTAATAASFEVTVTTPAGEGVVTCLPFTINGTTQ